MSNILELGKLMDTIEACKLCKLHALEVNVRDEERGYGKLLPFVGKKKVLFVGTNPSICRRKGDVNAFFGHTTGDLIEELFTKVGLRKKDYCWCNLVQCSTINNELVNNVQIRSCSHFALELIDLLDIKLIVPLGGVATSFFRGRFSCITKFNGVDVFSLRHPAWVAYERKNESAYLEDLELLKHAMLTRCVA